jgi:integrase
MHTRTHAVRSRAYLRRGEALGLSWADLDFTANTVHVRHSLQRLDGSLQLVPSKTRASASVIAAPPSLTKMLAKHRIQQQKERLALGSDGPGLDYVFTSTVGTPLEPRNLSRQWAREQAGLPHLRFHDLRHSCATFMTALGVHPRVIMGMLRHSQISARNSSFLLSHRAWLHSWLHVAYFS